MLFVISSNQKQHFQNDFLAAASRNKIKFI